MYAVKFAAHIVKQVFVTMRTRKREAAWARTYVNQLQQRFGGQLSEPTYKKIVTSYSIYIPMICDVFTGLRGRKTNRLEKERILLYFICSSVFDDFCDLDDFTAEQLHSISYSPATYKATTLAENIFLHAHQTLLGFVKEKQAYHEATLRLFKAQVDSDKQFDPAISNEELQRITLEKGGFSVLLCHFYLDFEASQPERNCWFAIGSIIQFTNDLYDIYKDLTAGSETLPNRTKNAHDCYDLFMQQVQVIEKQAALLPYNRAHKQNFMAGMLGICSFGSLAIYKLLKIQGDNPTLPPLRSLPRKALIVDMEKRESIWYCIRFTYKQLRRWVKQYA